MKNLLLLLAITLIFSSCSKDEIIYEDKTYFEYNPDQELMIDINVVYMNGAKKELNDMIIEVNADYYNRYGIGVNLLDSYNDELEDIYSKTRAFLPQDFSDEALSRINVYVLPIDYMQFEAYGYAVTQSNAVILREDAQTTRTLAHEIAHVLGLDHIEEENNIMRPYKIADQYDEPNDFNERQIKLLKNNIINKFY